MSEQTPFLCLALCRFFGTLGFFVCAWPTFRIAEWHWKIAVSLDMVGDLSKLGSAGLGALSAATIVGLFGLVVGQGVGASIRVRDNSTALRINILWHCVGNGALIWVALSGVLASAVMGDSSVMRTFAHEHGTRFFLSSAIIGTAGAAFIALFIGNLLIRAPRVDGAGEKLMLTLPIAVGIPAGVVEALLWGFPVTGGIALGFLYPLLLTTLCSGMWERDQAARMRPTPETL